MADARPTYEELQARVAELEHSLAQSLERQDATSEVLEVISRAPSDLQAALDEIVLKASRLLDSRSALVLRVTQGRTERVAVAFNGEVAHRSRLDAPTPVPENDGDNSNAALIREGRTFMRCGGPDAIQQEAPNLADLWRSTSTGSSLTTPLVTTAGPFGALIVSRESPEPYRGDQISLFETFGRQAVIAIENARLFRDIQERNREVSEALEREQATREVLSVISQAPTNVQPVFEAMAATAAALFEPHDAITVLLVQDGVLRIVAHAGPDMAPPGWTREVGRGWAAGRAVLDRRTIHIPDFLMVAGEYPEGAATARENEYRTMIAVPLLRSGEPVGVITVRRTEFQPFTPDEIALLETFADQAVIAIENARLFNELQERNREVSEALEQQTAMAEVLEIISRRPTSAQPVSTRSPRAPTPSAMRRMSPFAWSRETFISPSLPIWRRARSRFALVREPAIQYGDPRAAHGPGRRQRRCSRG